MDFPDPEEEFEMMYADELEVMREMEGKLAALYFINTSASISTSYVFFFFFFFLLLLTVHLSIFLVSVINQLDARNF